MRNAFLIAVATIALAAPASAETKGTCWYFVSISDVAYNRGTSTVVGPFSSAAQCLRVRRAIISTGLVMASVCWEA